MHRRLHITEAEARELHALSDAVRANRNDITVGAMVRRMKELWATGGEGEDPVFSGPGFTPIEILADKA